MSSVLAGPDGPIEVLVTGSGSPTTVFAHGLAGSIDETRPFGSGVAGTKAFFHFRGHGATVGPESAWTYAAVAAELMAVADATGATRGLGVSLGAGALLRAALDQPDRFERLVFVLPATIDTPRTDPAIVRMQLMAEHIEHRDLAALAEALVAEQPEAVRERADVQVWASKQARRLAATSLARGLRELPQRHPIEDRSELAVITAPALVIGQEGDEAHPAAIAEELAARLPNSSSVVFPAGGVLWSHRRETRAVISDFLNG